MIKSCHIKAAEQSAKKMATGRRGAAAQKVWGTIYRQTGVRPPRWHSLSELRQKTGKDIAAPLPLITIYRTAINLHSHMQSDHAPCSSVQKVNLVTLSLEPLFRIKAGKSIFTKAFVFVNYNHLFQEQKQFPNISCYGKDASCYKGGGGSTTEGMWRHTAETLSMISTSFSSDYL